MGELQNLLKELNYEVKISKTPTGCLVEYPNKKLGKSIEGGKTHYRVVYGKNPKVYIKENDGPEAAIAPLPDYACRPLIFFDIVKHCNDIGYSLDLVSYQGIDDTNPSFELVVEGPRTKKGCVLEATLSKLFIRAIYDDFAAEYYEEAETKEVADGFLWLAALFIGEQE